MNKLLVALCFCVLPAAADPLADLRTVLHRYRADSRFAVTAAVQVKGDSKDVAGTRGGSGTFEVQDDPSGFTIHVPRPVLTAARAEAETKKRDAEHATPTRTAMVALTVFDVIDAMDAAAMLLNDLDGATLVETRPGRDSTFLRMKVKPTLAGTRSRLVNEPVIELRLWLDANGIPTSAERDSNFSASLLVVKAGNLKKEKWEFAVTGDRLYASRSDQENKISAVGKSIVTWRSVNYVVK